VNTINKIDIVIVNWNAGLYLKECVESVIQFGDNVVGDIVVVDNASNDDSISYIEDFTQVELIVNPENFGFAKACNIGAKVCSSENILFLNPDARIYEKTLTSCLEYLDDIKNISVGILGVILEDSRGEVSRSCARFPSMFNVVSGAIGANKLIPSLGPFMKEWDHLTTREVDQVIGAFFLTRSSVYKKLNGFDERFFVYFEEIDFAYRAKKEGYKSVYYSGAKAFHYGGISSSQVIANRLYFELNSRVKYFYKHFGIVSVVLIILTTLFIALPVKLIHAIFIRQSFTLFMETLKGYQMFLISVYRLNFR